MVSAFALQLQAIANNSSHELDLRAQRNAHAESLLFGRSIAIKQDFETIYNICLEGFYELCNLDPRFRDFERNVFSEQSKSQDREHMTKADNEALDLVLKRCLSLIGGRILLAPAVKALEWLVRRFRVHVYNVDDFLFTLLPYHEVQIWATSLSIVSEDKVVESWKFVRPYLGTTWNIPRHAIAYAAAHNDVFFSGMNQYVLEACRQGVSHPALMRYWSSIVVEAVTNRVTQTLSGRKEVQKQRANDQLLRILPFLSDAFEIPGSSDLIATCYAISVVIASKIDLSDQVLDSLLLATALSISTVDGNATSAIITISLIATQKSDRKIPRKVLETLADLQNFTVIASSLINQYPIRQLILSLVDTAISCIKPKNANHMTFACEKFIHSLFEADPARSTSDVFKIILSKIMKLNPEMQKELEVRNALVTMVQRMNENETLSTAMSEAMAISDQDSSDLEDILGMVIGLPQPPYQSEDVEMIETTDLKAANHDIWDSLPHTWENGSSFLAANDFARFSPLATAFEKSYVHKDTVTKFSELPIWSSVLDGKLLWHTFLLRLACSSMRTSLRIAALDMLSQSIADEPGCEVQSYVAYTLTLMADSQKAIRKRAASFLLLLQAKVTQSHNKHKSNKKPNFYNFDETNNLSVHNDKQLGDVLSSVVIPTLEECILDSSYVVNATRRSFRPNTSAEVKKAHRKILHTLLTKHALSTQLLKVKVVLASMLTEQNGRNSALLPIYEWWYQLSEDDISNHAVESGLKPSDMDTSLTRLVDFKDPNNFSIIASSAEKLVTGTRQSLVRAFFENLRLDWPTWTAGEQLTVGETMFRFAFSEKVFLSSCARGVLQSVKIPSGALAAFLQIAQAGSSQLPGLPSAKRRRRSSSGQQPPREKIMRDINDATSKASLALELVDNNAPELKPELLGSLFETLAGLKRLQQARISSPYLLNLCLGSIRAILSKAETTSLGIDVSGIRSDLLIDCLKSFDNIEVQNAALQVCASLSRVAPDAMLHNVMSIFAFIGNTISVKDDEHSLNVVNEAIDKIVPALIASLKKSAHGFAPSTSLSTIFTSFTSAYDHFPPHRRVSFYQRLIVKLGLDEHGYLLIAMLAVRNTGQAFTKFLQDLVSGFEKSSRFELYQQLVSLTMDLSSPVPRFSASFFGLSKSTSQDEKIKHINAVLEAGTITLDTPVLKPSSHNPFKLMDGERSAIEILREAFSTTLELIQNMKSVGEGSLTLSKRCLELLLELPSLSQLLEMLTSILDTLDTELKTLALRALAVQLTNSQHANKEAKDVALQFLVRLERYIEHGEESTLLLSCLNCMERISEMYGRKDLDAVVRAAETIVGSKLGEAEISEKVRVSMILTLATMVEVLKEACVPIVHPTLSQLFVILTPFWSKPVINAACALLSAVVSHSHFIIDELQLKRILVAVIALRSEGTGMGDDPDISALLKSIASKMELDTILAATLSTISDDDVENMRLVARSLLELCAQAIEQSPKSVVMKESTTISKIFLLVMQRQVEWLNSQQPVQEQTIDPDVSTALKTASIKFIYKINDTTLRPIFESWVDWSVCIGATDVNKENSETQPKTQLQTQRQRVLFDLLTHFFDTLKAIVSSYAGFLTRSISTILTSCTTSNTKLNKSSKDSKPSSAAAHSSTDNDVPTPLVTTTLTLFKTIAAHDADGFLATPSQFDLLAAPLITTLTLSARKVTRHIATACTIPAIVSLTTATQDSPSTHSTLASQIVALRRHSSPYVRLASIKTLLAITDDEDVGDEFVANTIGVGGAGEGGVGGARGGGSSVGDIMIYVNEMLEDDDENVEREVRLWVQKVRAKVGDDIFEV